MGSTRTSDRTTTKTTKTLRDADSMYLTEQMAMERHRSLLREASRTRPARKSRALRRVARRAERAEHRADVARRTEARLRSALPV